VNEVGKSVIHGGEYYFDDYESLMVERDGVIETFRRFDREIRSFEFATSELLHVGFNDRLSSYRVDGDSLELLNEHATLNSVSILEADGSGSTWGWSVRTPLLELRSGASGEVRVKRHDLVAGRDMLAEDHEMAVTSKGPVLVFDDCLVRYDPETREWDKTSFDPGMGRPLALDFLVRSGGMAGWIIYWNTELSMNLLVEVTWPVGQAAQWIVLPWVEMERIGKVTRLKHVDEPDPFLVIAGMKGLIVASRDVVDHIPPPGKPVIWEGSNGLMPARDRTLKFGQESIRYEFSTPVQSQYYPVRYQTRITGVDREWSHPSAFPFRETGQLFDGMHEVQVRAVDPFGRTGPATVVRLEILPPWKRTIWAWLTAAGIVLLILLATARTWQLRVRLQKAKLEALVDARTRELQEAHEFKDLFIANLSHEIRNPLNGVIGLIGQLKEDTPPPPDHLSSLRGAARYLRKTVEAVLDFSKLQSGIVELSEEVVDLHQAVSGVTGIYRQKADEKGLKFSTNSNFPPATRIITDEGKLQQILGNLVSNAVKFTDQGGIEVEVRLSDGDPGKGTLDLRVQDSGKGVSQEERELIFDKFYQVRTDGIKTRGTGLGLSLIKGYLDHMGGNGFHRRRSGGRRFCLCGKPPGCHSVAPGGCLTTC
jgi:signal transduction histidine kinase